MSEKPRKNRYKFNYGGRYSTVASVRRWSAAAAECYLRNCVCKDCFYDSFFRKTREEYELGDGYTCKMKATVLELVRSFGVPDLNAHYAKEIDDELLRQDEGDENRK